MADRSKIEWTDATWNPTRGCSRVSEGCVNCYAEIMAARFSEPGQWGHGFAEIVRKQGDPLWLDHRWTGKVEIVEDKLLDPLKWKKPRRIFVNSTSDLFHERLPNEAIDKVFAVMALCPQHTFQILTKRPERMREYISGADLAAIARMWAPSIIQKLQAVWPLSNVWLGTSCEDQPTADERIPHLIETPAEIRFVSCEPLLGPINLFDFIGPWAPSPGDLQAPPMLDWIIAGGESGPNARPMHPDWARSLRGQCATAGVAFFFKQWGEWAHLPEAAEAPDGAHFVQETGSWMTRAGKKAAGRILDGREHNEFPEIHA